MRDRLGGCDDLEAFRERVRVRRFDDGLGAFGYRLQLLAQDYVP